ncbi:MAG: pyridoxamine 5'-phosphate oxidase family protein [Muribaculaceae bacterium]|nr:pyridoxamine 5'-phosphate oxidase family protein [Muribaculaceae bacterium]
MRKAARQRDAAWALSVFRHAPFATLSLVRPDGSPYGVPVSIVVGDDTTLYFHCADEGEKIDCIAAQPLVSVSAVSRCTPCYEEEKHNFTMHYCSAIATGRATVVQSPAEKTEALRLLCERFLPHHMHRFDEAVARSLDRTTIIRIDLTEPPVGKCKE